MPRWHSAFAPLFKASDPVADAMGTAGHDPVAAVSTDGTTFRLHSAEAISQAAEGALFGDLPGREVETAGRPVASGLAPGRGGPQGRRSPRSLKLAVASTEDFLGDRPYVRLSFRNGTMGMVRPRWRCDTHGETYVQADNGPCPRHPGATLQAIP